MTSDATVTDTRSWLAPPPRLLRFALTGVAGFAVDFGTLVFLHSGLLLPLGVSTAVACLVGGIVHYGLTRYWVFPQANPFGEAWRSARYVSLGAANAAVNVMGITMLVHLGLEYRPAKIITVALLFFVNYFLTPRLVMRTPGTVIP